MKLLWKLLRQHISIGQFAGFVFANLIGMTIVLAGYQFYKDVLPVFTSKDSFMKPNYIMVSKVRGTFSKSDVTELQEQSFTEKVGAFTTTNYKINLQLGINNTPVLNTEMFFESVTDDFVEIDLHDWQFSPDEKVVPIILPRTYIDMYNFGIARQRSLPQVSEGMMSMIDVTIFAHGNGKEAEYKGKVVAFSSSLNSVLVPQTFIDWTNNEYAPEDHTQPTHLLMQVKNPADKKIQTYFEQNSLEMESEKLKAEKTTYFLRLIVTLVMGIGVIISILSFYILMLSIYLLVQKNTDKLQNLLLIGYKHATVALPYQLLTVGMNATVLIFAILAVIIIRLYYMNTINTLYPEVVHVSLLPAITLGAVLFVMVSIFNSIIIRRKINNL